MKNIGVDLGTGNICSRESEGNIPVTYKVRDAFFRLDPLTFLQGADVQFGENMLKKAGANYIKIEDKIHVLGDDAIKFANLFHKEAQRPMSQGILNPKEPNNAILVKELIRGIAGAGKENDNLFFCVPAKPIDADYDIVFHTEMTRSIFRELGYVKINNMVEGLAIAYSECEDKMYSAICISFGSGMTNVCYSHLGVPVFAFSLARCGDWIDWSSARTCNETAVAMQIIKESGMDIRSPKNGKEQAIAIYYNNLMDYVVFQFNKMYREADPKSLPNMTDNMDVVFAGGTSMIKGFNEIFSEKVKKEFPIPVGSVRQAKDPLFTVCNGLYNAACTQSK